MTYDAILIGAGPAGSCASAILAEYGHRVLVLEREKFPRYHIGESLIPFTFGPLERIGMIPKMKASHFVKKVQRHLRAARWPPLAALLFLHPLRSRNRGPDLAGAALRVRPDAARQRPRKRRGSARGNDRQPPAHGGRAGRRRRGHGPHDRPHLRSARADRRSIAPARKPSPPTSAAGACATRISTRSPCGPTTRIPSAAKASTKATPPWPTCRRRAGSGTSRSTTA